MSDKSFLHWPFFEEKHWRLAEELEIWAGSHLAHVDHSDTDAACRHLVTALGDAGFLQHSGAPDGKLDVRSLCLIRETLARHDGLADFAFAMQGLGTGAISLFAIGLLARDGLFTLLGYVQVAISGTLVWWLLTSTTS